MSNSVLENGVYCVRMVDPVIPSSITSGAMLMAENELFDQVFVPNEPTKNTKSLPINGTNGITVDGKEEAVHHDHGHVRHKESTVRLHVDEESTTICCNKKTKGHICAAVVMISLALVICLHALGIVFFYTDVPKNKNFDYYEQRTGLLNSLELCLALESANDVVTSNSDGCFSYTNEICFSSLQSVAGDHGINVTGGSIMVQNNMHTGISDPESILKAFLNFATGKCRSVGFPLLCQYFYPICDPNSGSAVTISEEQCIDITETVCPRALQLAKTANLFSIPDCSTFNSSEMQMDDNITDVTNSNSTEMDTTTTELNSNITCHPEFDVRCGRCVPNCHRFSETSKGRQKTIDIFFIIAALTCVIGGTFVILVSILRRSVMFDFPSVLIIYMTIVMMVISILVLISYGARDELYCTQAELPLAYENPTFFCQFSGFILHAGVLQIVLYWLLHLIHLFLKFIFPFAIRRYDTKKWKRIFHITELILINLFTVIVPIYIVVDSKYYPYGFPPVLCVPNATFTFYSLVLPIILMLCLGTCVILLMLWRLQVRTGFVQKSKSKISKLLRLTTAEVKVVALLCFFLTFGVVNAIYFSLYARSYNYVLSLALEYATCQSTGYNETCEAHKDEIVKNRYHGLANTSYLLMGLLTISNFLFAIHVKQLKGQVRRFSVKAASRFRSTLNQSRVASQGKQSRES